MNVTVQHLQSTGIGRTVNSLRKDDGEVGTAAKALISKWKEMVANDASDGSEEEKAEECDEEEDDDDVDKMQIDTMSNDDEGKSHKHHEYTSKSSNSHSNHHHNHHHHNHREQYSLQERSSPGKLSSSSHGHHRKVTDLVK